MTMTKKGFAEVIREARDECCTGIASYNDDYTEAVAHRAIEQFANAILDVMEAPRDLLEDNED